MIRCSVTANSREHAFYGPAVKGMKLPGNGINVPLRGRVENREGIHLLTVPQPGKMSAPYAMANICEDVQLSSSPKKRKELIRFDQNGTEGRPGTINGNPARTTAPSGRQRRPTAYTWIDTMDMGNPLPPSVANDTDRPIARRAVGGRGREDGRSQRRCVMQRIGVDPAVRGDITPARKGADVRLVLRCERIRRTAPREESK